MIQYHQIPTSQQWLKDSGVTFSTRSKDPILSHIDELVKLYQSAQQDIRCLPLLGDLFFSLDYWLKIYQTNAVMEKGRQPAIYALYVAAAHRLCALFGCTINGLPRELELTFGRELSADGATVDLVQRRAAYIDPKNLWQYKLLFKGGLAYQFPWWETMVTKAAVPAESSRAYNKDAFVINRNPNARPNTGYGFFVMSMSRDFYMMKHKVSGPNGGGLYHSAYLNGGTVAAAGSMLIRDGRILRIRSDSGHYRPQDTNMVGALRALQMLGVSLANIKVEDHEGETETSAANFIAANGSWDKFRDARSKTIQDNKAAFTRKPGPDLSKRPDPRHMWTKPPEVKGNPFLIKPLSPPRVNV